MLGNFLSEFLCNFQLVSNYSVNLSSSNAACLSMFPANCLGCFSVFSSNVFVIQSKFLRICIQTFDFVSETLEISSSKFPQISQKVLHPTRSLDKCSLIMLNFAIIRFIALHANRLTFLAFRFSSPLLQWIFGNFCVEIFYFLAVGEDG